MFITILQLRNYLVLQILTEILESTNFKSPTSTNIIWHEDHIRQFNQNSSKKLHTFANLPNQELRFLVETFFPMLLIFNEERGRITEIQRNKRLVIGTHGTAYSSTLHSNFVTPKKRVVTTENEDDESNDIRDVT